MNLYKAVCLLDLKKYPKQTYGQGNHHKKNNVEDIIGRWAPPSENDTDAYIDFVCDKTGFNPMDQLDNSIEHYLPLVKSIIQMENGKQPYTDELLVEGMYKAWEGFPTKSSAT